MKFYVVVNFYLVSLSLKFHEDLSVNACARVENVCIRDITCTRAFTTRARAFILFAASFCSFYDDNQILPGSAPATMVTILFSLDLHSRQRFSALLSCIPYNNRRIVYPCKIISGYWDE